MRLPCCNTVDDSKIIVLGNSRSPDKTTRILTHIRRIICFSILQYEDIETPIIHATTIKGKNGNRK